MRVSLGVRRAGPSRAPPAGPSVRRGSSLAHCVRRTPCDAPSAETIGAFTLTFIGAGAAAAANDVHDPTLIGAAIANGLAIGVMVFALGPISGGEFQPGDHLRRSSITRRIKPALAG